MQNLPPLPHSTPSSPPTSAFQVNKQIEKSQIYLGYKMLWVVKLFLGGHKFPSGTFRESKWRMYINDVTSFIAVKEIAKTLLSINVEAFFQIISILFCEGKPCEFVQMGRDPNVDGGNVPSVSHQDILKCLDEICMNQDTLEETKMQYLFFVANVASKSRINQSPQYYFSIAKDVLKNHREF